MEKNNSFTENMQGAIGKYIYGLEYLKEESKQLGGNHDESIDIKPKKKKTTTMTEAQKNRQKHAIWDYYKKKNENLTSKPSKNKK